MNHAAYLSIIFGAGLWGFISIWLNFLMDSGLSSYQVSATRVTLGAIIMLVITAYKNPEYLKIKLKDSWLFIGTGIISLLFFNFNYFVTIRNGGVAIAAMLLYTAPAFVVIMSVIFFKEKVTLQKILALCSTLLGCAFLTGVLAGKISIASGTLFTGLLSGFGYALYSIFAKPATEKYHPLTITTYTFVFAALGNLAFINVPDTLAKTSSLHVLLACLGLAFFCTVLPYLFYTKGLEKVDPGIASILATIELVVASIVGFTIFKEEVTLEKLLGIILIMFSVVLLNLKRK